MSNGDISFTTELLDTNQRMQAFKASLASSYPSTQSIDFDSVSTVVSPFILNLPKSILQMATDAIREIYARSRNKIPELGQWNVNVDQGAVLMGYDFHLQIVNGAPKLKLIEINTNASGFMIGSVLCESRNIKSNDALEKLKQSFLSELAFAKSKGKTPKIAIVDTKPSEQKMYLEFLMYRDLFKKWGWDAEILDLTDINFETKSLDFIYNRWTDFYLSETQSKILLEGYLQRKAVISPNPKEYFLLADKNRLLELVKPEDDFALKTFLVNKNSDVAFINANKKRFIFKPTNSFGGKSVYRGDRITRKVLDRMIEGGCLAQEYFPPGTIKQNDVEWKFDLRFYAYKDQTQFCLARMFTGQIMNFQNLGSGFAPINWI
jgi:hypothetical protein